MNALYINILLYRWFYYRGIQLCRSTSHFSSSPSTRVNIQLRLVDLLTVFFSSCQVKSERTIDYMMEYDRVTQHSCLFILCYVVVPLMKKAGEAVPPGLTRIFEANLEDQALETLLDPFNDFWTSRKLSQEWKTAEVRFIPKPGKSPHIDNLWLISLTSCISIIMKRIVLKCLQQHLDETQQMPDPMFGFIRHLETQDVLMQLKKEIVIPATHHGPFSR